MTHTVNIETVDINYELCSTELLFQQERIVTQIKHNNEPIGIAVVAILYLITSFLSRSQILFDTNAHTSPGACLNGLVPDLK